MLIIGSSLSNLVYHQHIDIKIHCIRDMVAHTVQLMDAPTADDEDICVAKSFRGMCVVCC